MQAARAQPAAGTGQRPPTWLNSRLPVRGQPWGSLWLPVGTMAMSSSCTRRKQEGRAGSEHRQGGRHGCGAAAAVSPSPCSRQGSIRAGRAAWRPTPPPWPLTVRVGTTLPAVPRLFLALSSGSAGAPGRAGGSRVPASWGVWLASQATFSTEPNRPMDSASRRMDQVLQGGGPRQGGGELEKVGTAGVASPPLLDWRSSAQPAEHDSTAAAAAAAFAPPTH
jgi:hypothetical protein